MLPGCHSPGCSGPLPGGDGVSHCSDGPGRGRDATTPQWLSGTAWLCQGLGVKCPAHGQGLGHRSPPGWHALHAQPGAFQATALPAQPPHAAPRFPLSSFPPRTHFPAQVGAPGARSPQSPQSAPGEVSAPRQHASPGSLGGSTGRAGSRNSRGRWELSGPQSPHAPGWEHSGLRGPRSCQEPSPRPDRRGAPGRSRAQPLAASEQHGHVAQGPWA